MKIFFATFAAIMLVGYFGACSKSEPTEATTRPVVVTEAKKPIIAQLTANIYGDDGYQAQLGFEGKLYNPNEFGLKDVKVFWQVYPRNSSGDVFTRFSCADSLSVEFAYIPPKTTYDFHTPRIYARTLKNMEGLGENPSDINRNPTFTFTPDR